MPAFEKAIEDNFDNFETFYYAAVCLLKGKKAYIKYDYFERKYLNITPNWRDTLQAAAQAGLPQADTTQLFKTLQVEMPECLGIR